MKRRIAILLLLLLSAVAATVAQQSVAVMDVKVLEGTVSVMNKAQIRGALEKGITQSPGYKAYNRTNLDRMAKELAFQRTGEVTDDQIRELGRKAGVDYILVSEVAKSGNDMYVNVSILNIETGEYDKSDNILIVKATNENIQTKCVELTQSMFGSIATTSGNNSNYSNNNNSNNYNNNYNSNSGNVQGDQTIAGIQMVYVQGGTFTMGCTSEQSDCEDVERPTHSVTLSNYMIGKYEVTVAQFRKFVEATGYQTDAEKEGWSYVYNYSSNQWEKKSGVNWRYDANGQRRYSSEDNHPVIHISWNDAVAYCKWLSQQTGKTFRLPTEAEWEFAARGGKKTNYYKYSGSNFIESVAWYWENAGKATHPVGQKQPNELGIYDMSGNVWELCYDWYDDYSSYAQTNPTGASSGIYRVERGGSWDSIAKGCRVAARAGDISRYRHGGVGFRLVLSL